MNDALKNFQKTVCPRIDRPEQLTERLLEEITKLKAELGDKL